MRWRGYDSQRGSFYLSLSLILLALAVTDLQAQSFVPTGNMTRPRTRNSATLLQDGRVLIVGGDTKPGYRPPLKSMIPCLVLSPKRARRPAGALAAGWCY
jgi:hypothetical protein